MKMKRILLIVCLMALTMVGIAQVSAESSRNVRHSYLGIGVKAGAMLPYYHYGNRPDLNSLSFDKENLNLIRPVFGVFVEIPMSPQMYFSPELRFLKRGDLRKFHNIPSNTETTYSASVNYFDLRLPIEMVLPIKGHLEPYVIGGANVGLVPRTIVIDTLFGIPVMDTLIHSGLISQDKVSIEVNKSNMSPFDFGVFGGIGARYTIDFELFSIVLKLEATYYFGLNNTYSAKEIQSQTPAANLGSGGTHYSVGSRYNRSWECNFSVVFPLHINPGDACSSFTKARGKGRDKRIYFGY